MGCFYWTQFWNKARIIATSLKTDIEIARADGAGAGYIVAVCGEIMTIP